eukprot:255218-Lingulodinium_polyedra.AAC.1
MAEHSVHSSSSDLQSDTCSDENMPSSVAEHPAFRHRFDAFSALASRQHERSLDCNVDLPVNTQDDELRA